MATFMAHSVGSAIPLHHSKKQVRLSRSVRMWSNSEEEKQAAAAREERLEAMEASIKGRPPSPIRIRNQESSTTDSMGSSMSEWKEGELFP